MAYKFWIQRALTIQYIQSWTSHWLWINIQLTIPVDLQHGMTDMKQTGMRIFHHYLKLLDRVYNKHLLSASAAQRWGQSPCVACPSSWVAVTPRTGHWPSAMSVSVPHGFVSRPPAANILQKERDNNPQKYLLHITSDLKHLGCSSSHVISSSTD